MRYPTGQLTHLKYYEMTISFILIFSAWGGGVLSRKRVRWGYLRIMFKWKAMAKQPFSHFCYTA